MILFSILHRKRTKIRLVFQIICSINQQFHSRFPQVLKNLRVADKSAVSEDEAVQAAIRAESEALGNRGRVLLRKSGTEPVIRVMCEAPTVEECERVVDAILQVIRSRGLAEV